MDIVNRFVNYVRIDTQSDEFCEDAPSTQKQFNLANLLVKELQELGVEDVYLSDTCVVYGHVKANAEAYPKIGFVSHMDTSPAMSGENVKPKWVKNYKGGKILLNKDLDIYLDPEVLPVLKKDIGDDLIVTDGTTLLGGDDKAGIACIMDMLQYLSENPELKHGQISIAFTPDEEVGRGVVNFDYERFDADYAYTVDGSDSNELCYECFNASAATVNIKGLSIHPGDAKGKMKNALIIAMEFESLLPFNEQPMFTEGYEGFHHLCDMNGECEAATMHYIIRDHDQNKLEEKIAQFEKAAETLNQEYGEGTIELEISHTYSNMKDKILENPEVLERARKAMANLGMEPNSEPVRGGTDGSNLTTHGLLCPNLGTGDRNCHGKFEYVNVRHMREVSRLLVEIVTL